MRSSASPTVKRLLAGGLLLVAALVVLVLGTGASGDDDGSYRVRAIFDSASFLVSGEDVKVAGVQVGTIESLDVTPDNKAAIVLRIDDPAFQNF
jgi:ABC-type transporter Mla subunit MlaD